MKRVFFACFLLLPCGLLFAAETLPLDSAKSYLHFTGEAFLHDFSGEAKEFSGAAQLDPAQKPPIQTAQINIQTASFTTFHKERDKNMVDWLKPQLHPKSHFELSRVTLTEGDYKTAGPKNPAQFIVSGTFTLNEVSQPLEARARGWREGNDVIIKGEATVNTSRHNLPKIKNGFLTVDEKVKVKYQLAFTLPPKYRIGAP